MPLYSRKIGYCLTFIVTNPCLSQELNNYLLIDWNTSNTKLHLSHGIGRLILILGFQKYLSEVWCNLALYFKVYWSLFLIWCSKTKVIWELFPSTAQFIQHSMVQNPDCMWLSSIPKSVCIHRLVIWGWKNSGLCSLGAAGLCVKWLPDSSTTWVQRLSHVRQVTSVKSMSSRVTGLAE